MITPIVYQRRGLRIYCASLFRNVLYPDVIAACRACGHDPFDWRENNTEVKRAFAQRESWSPAEYVRALRGPAATTKFCRDLAAIEQCDACVLLLPASASAHSEAIYARHTCNKPTLVFLDPHPTGDLMHRLFDNGFVASIDELLHALAQIEPNSDAATVGDVGTIHAPSAPIPDDFIDLEVCETEPAPGSWS
jgi:hypothetical protein